MLKSLAVFAALASVGLAFAGDAKSTAISLITVITIRGVAFASTKVVGAIDDKMEPVVDFTAWCLCGVSLVDIVKSAQLAIMPFISLVTASIGGIERVIQFLSRIG